MHIIDTSFAAQSKLFEKLLSEALQNGPPVGPGLHDLQQPCSTLAMLPQKSLAQSLAARVAEWAQLFPDQIYYGAQNIHLTVCALPDVVKGSILHRHLKRSLSSHVGALRALEMPIGGVGIIGSAVVFKAFDVDGLLGRFVKLLAADIEEEGFAMADYADLHTKIFWLTGARLINPPSEAFLQYINKQKDEKFGTAQFESMELVTTDSLFSEEATSVMDSYSLGDLS